jgi:hypothetical protein
MVGTWPLTVAAVVYFAYAAVFIGGTLYAHLIKDPRFSVAFALVGVFVAAFCAALGVAMLKAKRGDTSWLIWVGSAAGSLGGFSLFAAGWFNVALFLSPMMLGLLGSWRYLARKMTANNAMDSDTYSAPLRAPNSARHRER